MPTPKFIISLREKVGHDLLFLPGVTAVVLDEADRVLLVRRADNHLWTLVTGCLEPDEQPAESIIREIHEETAVNAVVDRLLTAETLPPSTCENGDRVQFVDVSFRCRYRSGEARVNDDESIDVGWFAVTDLPGDLPERHRRCIRMALEAP
ncbi:ADP-ribose pyrophosphatase YjhB (NUDIX family) [Stackebrandtia endophytica]|uniref:ADP-ribose pyrophosphatase YjhB (NUDIX family) n=1 Tax=Stackebrandtia endophytica TaxID=1496996 RepID=A0A543AWH3_9ACTN|nr:NUDIX domain-containing protein [Stackebrandtia endophytica]TQL76927.1 ADP-ribose pyrophosphatase YjhB (NUDIX family) [Stackebrandtia endophytica]